MSVYLPFPHQTLARKLRQNETFKKVIQSFSVRFLLKFKKKNQPKQNKSNWTNIQEKKVKIEYFKRARSFLKILLFPIYWRANFVNLAILTPLDLYVTLINFLFQRNLNTLQSSFNFGSFYLFVCPLFALLSLPWILKLGLKTEEF